MLEYRVSVSPRNLTIFGPLGSARRNPRVQIEPDGLTLACQILKPSARALLDGVPILLKMRAFGWAGGDVGEGVEDGVSVGAEFLPVADEAVVEVGGEGGSGFLDGRWVVRFGVREAKDGVHGEGWTARCPS
jgi:hypothetical protein